jgi:predicted RNase H-like nuclease (RuvC/YqgF family)
MFYLEELFDYVNGHKDLFPKDSASELLKHIGNMEVRIAELKETISKVNQHSDRLAEKNLLYLNERATHLDMLKQQKDTISHRNMQIKDLKEGVINLNGYCNRLEKKLEKAEQIRQCLTGYQFESWYPINFIKQYDEVKTLKTL